MISSKTKNSDPEMKSYMSKLNERETTPIEGQN